MTTMATTMRTMTGPEVRALRRDLGMTQEDLAHELGVTVSTVNRWENGHTRPSRLAHAGLDRLATTRPVQATFEDVAATAAHAGRV
jgi:DNA-binding transcriptional regulator YiaG